MDKTESTNDCSKLSGDVTDKRANSTIVSKKRLRGFAALGASCAFIGVACVAFSLVSPNFGAFGLLFPLISLCLGILGVVFGMKGSKGSRVALSVTAIVIGIIVIGLACVIWVFGYINIPAVFRYYYG